MAKNGRGNREMEGNTHAGSCARDCGTTTDRRSFQHVRRCQEASHAVVEVIQRQNLTRPAYSRDPRLHQKMDAEPRTFPSPSVTLNIPSLSPVPRPHPPIRSPSPRAAFPPCSPHCPHIFLAPNFQKRKKARSSRGSWILIARPAAGPARQISRRRCRGLPLTCTARLSAWLR
jgi:hypothetical protein